MIIREATADDRPEVVSMLEQSQSYTGLPDPIHVPSESLEAWLFSRQALVRFVAVEDDEIIGHCMIEPANPEHEPAWRSAVEQPSALGLYEVGGAFVRPYAMQRGIGSALLQYSLGIVNEIPGIAVSATWSANEHVKRMFVKHGAVGAGESHTKLGSVSLFVF